MSEEVRKYKAEPEKIFENLKKLSSDSEFNVDKVDEVNQRLKLSTGLSLFSYGEEVEVLVNREIDGGARVYVNSKPKIWFNVTAEGNNKRNVQRIFEIIEKELI